MGFRIRGSHVLAVALAAGLGFWMFTGEYQIGGTSAGAQVAPIAEREAERDQELFEVRFIPLNGEERLERIKVRGRTQADALVSVRSETSGVVEERRFEKGDRIAEGELLCILDRGAREADLARAVAQLTQAETDYEANRKLNEKGFAAQNRLPALKAAVDAAKAGLAAAEEELARTEIRANASGIVQEPIAEKGDMLAMGGVCATLIDTDPMLFTGQVSERSVGRVENGMTATIELISGKSAEGTVRYIAPSADPATRTFEIEIEIDGDAAVRDGVTAEAIITLPAGKAFRISPSWVTLADDGQIGLRIVDEDDRVAFRPIDIVAQEQNAFWIRGAEEGDRVITLGQEYVVAGEKVVATLDERYKEQLAGLEADGSENGKETQ